MLVTALKDVKSSHGFHIAKAGETGRAIEGACPHDIRNIGKILVKFNKRGYWVMPDDISFSTLVDLRRYIASTWHGARNKKVTKIPEGRAYTHYHFGMNLKLCRQARNLSQIELGEKMGIHGAKLAQSTICYREGRPHSPNGKFINAAARALDVPAFIFFVPLSDEGWFGAAKTYISNLSSNVYGERET